MKLALVPPAAMVTDAGTLRAEAGVELSVTEVAVFAAGLDDIEQVTLAPALTLAGVQLTPLRMTGTTTLSETLCVAPFSVALIIALVLAVTAPAVAVKLALVPPAAMLTDAGTLSAEAALELSATVVALLAVPLNDTEQVTLAPALTLGAPQLTPVRMTGATTLSETLCVTPFSVALRVALVLAVTAPAVAVKLALVPPAAMLTDAGTLSAEAALELSATVVALLAVPLNDTEHVTLAPALTLGAPQLTPLRMTGATTLSETLCVTPFSVALRVALVLAVTAPAVAVKLALVPPAAMLTDAGTLSAEAALELSATVVALLAVPLNDTEQVTLAPALTLGAPQLTPLRMTGATTLSETLCVTPFSVALRVALVLAVTAPAVAVKLALVPPAAMLTDAGTLSAEAALELSATVVALLAAPLNDTEHVTLAPALTLVAGQVTPLRLTTAGGTTVSETLFVTPVSVAPIVALVLAVTVPAVAVKLPLVPPAAMLTDAGTLSTDAALELSATLVAAEAAPLNDTVQMTLAPELTLAVPQLIPPRLTTPAGTTVSETLLVTPVSVAPIVALVLAVTVPAVAVKLPLVPPAAMLTDAGTPAQMPRWS